MADKIVRQGDGFAIVQSDALGPAVPYPAVNHKDGSNHGFIDLRDHPEMIAEIPEARDSEGLKELLWSANAPGSPIMSLGCECSLFERDVPQTHHVGGYVDVTFRDPARNIDPQALVELAEAILHRITVAEEYHVGFEMIVQPLRHFFGLPGRYALMVKPHGYGDSASKAWLAFDHAVFATAAAIRDLWENAERPE